MSAAVINPYRAINDFTNKLSNNEYGKRYGEVFITQRHTAILRCCLCEEEHLIYQQFVEHIFAHHYSGINATSPQLTPEVAPVVKEEIDGEEPNESPTEVQPVEFAAEVLPEVGVFQLTENVTQENPLCEVQIQLKEEAHTELDEVPLVEAVHEISSFPEKDDPVRVTSESSREPSPMPKPKGKYKRKKPYVKKQPDKYNERTHKCETCDATFKTSRALTLHNRRHTGETRYECEVCKKGFYTNAEMMVHKRRHTGERPFVCKFCGGRFTSSSWRNRHEKQHERRIINARTFKCEFCEKSFNEAVHLKVHMVAHTGERKHVCNVCNGAFLHRKNLVVHMKIHANAREYACNICGKAFNQPSARLLHMRNKHKVVGAVNAIVTGGSTATTHADQSSE